LKNKIGIKNVALARKNLVGAFLCQFFGGGQNGNRKKIKKL